MARSKRWYQALIDWLFFYVGVPVAVFILRVLYATMRWEVHGRENLRPYWDEGRPVIIAFWHGRLILMPHQWERKGNAHVLIGNHRNGEIIARMIAPFGIGAVRGSSNHGGKQAREQLSEAYFQGGGQTLGFTPDGPHGPIYVSKIGMAKLSRSLRIPVVWLSASAKPALRAPTWDKFMIPLPFSKGVITWAPAIEPQTYDSLDLEAYRQALDDFGRRYLEEADRLAGHPQGNSDLASATS